MAASEKTLLRHQKWKREILAIIRSTDDASRITVKRRRGLSMDVTLALIEELLEEGLIRVVGKADSSKAGRKATLLEINPQGAYFIGIRFSAAGISGVLMNFACETVAACRREFVAQPDEDELVRGVLECIEELTAHPDLAPERLMGIGLGAPGIIDPQHGRIVRYVHIPGIRDLPLRQIVQERFHVPTYLEHGVKCSARAALSEYESLPARDMLFMQTGRGVHMCVIVGGKIHTGTHYLSGEIGHMLVTPEETLEELTSSSTLCRRAQEAVDDGNPLFSTLCRTESKPITLNAIAKAAALGCEGCRELLKRAGNAAGCALAGAIMVVNPSDIILNGTLCASSCFEDAVRQTLAARCIPESLKGVRLCFIASDPRQDATGAAMIPFHEQFSSVREPAGDSVPV